MAVSDSSRIVGNTDTGPKRASRKELLHCRPVFSDQLARIQAAKQLPEKKEEWSGLRESNSHLNLGKVSVNFKNAGNGGLFTVFEVPQMENGWKMENGRWIYHPWVLLRSCGRFAKWPSRGVSPSNASHKRTYQERRTLTVDQWRNSKNDRHNNEDSARDAP